MSEPPQCSAAVSRDQDFSRFWRILEGDCELLSARYSSQSFGRHSHDRYAIGVIVSGVEKLYYRGSHHFGTAGSVVTITPGEIHDGLPGSDEGWMYRMLYIDPAWLNKVLLQARYAADHIHLFQQALTQDQALATQLLHAHQVIESARQPLERETVMLELVANVFEQQGVILKQAKTAEREAVRRIRKKLEDQLSDTISLAELGEFVGMDPLYMIRVFKNEVGTSPHNYQIQQRVAQVQRLLRRGEGIADASFACGFFDQSHMARAFKKVVGVTPGNFRKGLQTRKVFAGA